MTPAKNLLPLPFEELIRRHERKIMRYLLRVTRDPDYAADLFQDRWFGANRAYPRIDSSTDLRPWLYAIATNLCRNRVRDHARRSRVLVAENEESPAAESMRRTTRLSLVAGSPSARYYWLLLVATRFTRRLFTGMLRKIATLPLPAG